jgi:hypothetical protein
LHEIQCGSGPVEKSELKTRREQAAWNYAAAFQNQFGFGPQKDGSYFQHPFRRWQSDAPAPSTPQGGHELAVR